MRNLGDVFIGQVYEWNYQQVFNEDAVESFRPLSKDEKIRSRFIIESEHSLDDSGRYVWKTSVKESCAVQHLLNCGYIQLYSQNCLNAKTVENQSRYSSNFMLGMKISFRTTADKTYSGIVIGVCNGRITIRNQSIHCNTYFDDRKDYIVNHICNDTYIFQDQESGKDEYVIEITRSIRF